MARFLRQTESKDLRLLFATYAANFSDTTLEIYSFLSPQRETLNCAPANRISPET